MAAIKPRTYTTTRDNETLSTLANGALKGKAVVSVLNSLNPSLKGKKLKRGTKVLHLMTKEYNTYLAQQAEAKRKAAQKKRAEQDAKRLGEAAPPNGNLHHGKNLKFRGLTVIRGQWAVVTLGRDKVWYTKAKTGKLVKGGTLKKGTSHRVMGTDKKLKTLVLEKSRHILEGAGHYTYYEVPRLATDLTATSPAKGKVDWSTLSIDVHKRPAYRRPSLRYKDKNGKYTNVVELRLTSFNQSLSNEINPIRTNGGWYINVVGEDLSPIRVSGWLMNTKGVNEFESFMNVYHNFLKAKRSGQYTKIPVVKLNHKNREYTGIVRALSIQETAEATLRVEYSMDFLVLSEKSLTASQIKALPSRTNKELSTDPYYYADLKLLFMNTVTGKGATL